MDIDWDKFFNNHNDLHHISLDTILLIKRNHHHITNNDFHQHIHYNLWNTINSFSIIENIIMDNFKCIYFEKIYPYNKYKHYFQYLCNNRVHFNINLHIIYFKEKLRGHIIGIHSVFYIIHKMIINIIFQKYNFYFQCQFLYRS